jgi:hypothetical protein
MVDGGRVGDAISPGRKGAVVTERADRRRHLHHRVLGDVLRFRARAAPAPGERIDPVIVALGQRRESGAVAGRRPSRQIAIGVFPWQLSPAALPR